MKKLFVLIASISSVAYGQTNTYPTSGNVKIFGTNEAWAEGLAIIKSSGWSGLRLNRNDPSGGNYSGNWALGYNASTGNDFSISTNYSGIQYDGLFHISNNSRNVGIGTTSPLSAVHISNTSNDLLRLQSTTGGLGNSAGIDFCTFSTPTSKVARIEAVDMGNFDGELAFYTDGDGVNNSNITEKMRISKFGNVGIGTTNPSQRLEILGSMLLNAENSAFGIDAQANARLGFIKKSGAYTTLASVTGTPIIFSQTDQANLFSNIASATITERMRIDANGNVGIGTTAPDAKLAVKGQIHAQEVKVDLNGAVTPDYVFEPSYKLNSLDSIKTYIDKNKHLPEVPSAKEMEKNGVTLAR